MIERLLQFIVYKGINKSMFYKKTGLSNGFLDKERDIGTSKLVLVLNSYPEMSIEWLVLGKGSMLKKDNSIIDVEKDTLNEPKTGYNATELSYIALLEETLKEKKEQLQDCKKEVESLKKYQNIK